MKGVVHKIRVPIYCQWVYLSFDEMALNRYLQMPEEKSNLIGYAQRMINPTTKRTAFRCYIEKVDERHIDATVVAHECFHLADLILEHAGCEYKKDSGNEHVAYLLDFLVGEVFDCLQKENEYRDKINGKR